MFKKCLLLCINEETEDELNNSVEDKITRLLYISDLVVRPL